jgi:hypothetical protein
MRLSSERSVYNKRTRHHILEDDILFVLTQLFLSNGCCTLVCAYSYYGAMAVNVTVLNLIECKYSLNSAEEICF